MESKVARICVLTATLLLGGEAHAASTAGSATAQGLFDEAKALLAEGKVDEACAKLEESQRLDPGSGTLLNLARCYERLGRLASAWSKYIEAKSASRAAGQTERETTSREAAAALEPRIARLRIVVTEASRVEGLEVRKDGVVVGPAQWGSPLPEDQGEHRVVARASGHEEWSTTVFVKGEGTIAEVTVPRLRDVPTSRPGVPPSDDPRSSSGLGAQRVVALVVGGAGLASLGVGGFFALRTLSKKDEAGETCRGGACQGPEGVAAGNDARSAGDLATVFTIAGAVGAVAGVTLWVTAPSREPAARVGMGPGMVSLGGAW